MCLITNTKIVNSISTHHVRAISPNEFKNPNNNIHQSAPDKIRWEIGLREATYQALRRERINTPNLKDDIYSAPILGFQDTATPFGDIAVLARGQLYNTPPQGYKFVQDLYRNDCDDCHNKPYRCENQQCAPYREQNSKTLMALWTVKRIRHRDLNSGHRYELQFTVSPMSPAANAEFITRNGNFDYNVPGHVFIIKVKNRQNPTNRQPYNRSEKYKSDSSTRFPNWNVQRPTVGDVFNPPTHHNLHEFTPNAINLQTGEFYIPSRHRIPAPDPHHTGYLIGIAPEYKPKPTPTPHTNHRFVKTHEKLQSEPVKHYHHHFYIPEVSDIDIDKKTEPPTTSVKPVLTSDNVQKFILTTGGVSAQLFNPHSAQLLSPTQIPITTNQGFAFGTTYKQPETTIPVQPIIFSQKYHTVPTFSTNEPTLYKIIAIQPTQPTPFNPSPYFIRYSEPDPTYSNNQPPTVAGYIAQIIPTSVPSPYISQPPESSTLSLFNTETEIPTTIKPKSKYPDSINAQLPPPKSGTDTTIPYVSSTHVSVISKPSANSESENKIVVTTTQLEHEDTSEDEHKLTELIATTPVTTIMKPINESTTETITTLEEKQEYSTLTSIVIDGTTESTTKYHRPKYRPYLDDLDIFANNKTKTNSKEISNEEIFSTRTTRLTTEPSTSTTTAPLRSTKLSKYLKYNRNRNNFNKYRNFNSKRLRARNYTRNIDDNVETKTSQSLITSISFKVNKNNRRNYTDFSRPAIIPSTHTDRPRGKTFHEINNDKEFNVFITEIPETTTITQQTKVFDDIAQTLVNHARAVTYLDNTKTTTPSNSHK